VNRTVCPLRDKERQDERERQRSRERYRERERGMEGSGIESGDFSSVVEE
jgi:hypothetical protein